MNRLLLIAFVVVSGCKPSVREAPRSETPRSESITFVSSEGKGMGRLFLPAQTPAPGLIALHADFGLDEVSLANAARLAESGYVVLAVDLYRGQVAQDQLEAHEMDRGLLEEQVSADIRAAIDFLLASPHVRKGGVGIIGWGMGGGHALDAARSDPRILTAVLCYGRLTTDAELLRPMKASVLGIYAGKDEGNPPANLAAFREAMARAGIRLTALEVFPEAEHGFLSRHELKDVATGEDAQRAWEMIEAHLKNELAPSLPESDNSR